MTDIIRVRARRFHALYELLLGGRRAPRQGKRTMPDHLSRDIGLPKDTSSERPMTQLDIMLPSAKT